MVAVRSAHINKAGEFDPEKWIASLGITSQKSCECLAETWAYCLQQTQGHPDASLLLWRGVEMVEILSTLSMDIDTLRAALLFPLADANVVSEDVLRESVGKSVVNLIHGVRDMAAIRQLKATHTDSVSSEQVDNVRRMLLAMVDDFRCVVIKLAERIAHLREVKDAPEDERVLAAKECTNIYAPLANRLGIGQLKWELEDYCFRYLHPTEYKRIAKLLHERRLDREHYIEEFVGHLRAEMKAEGVKAEVYGRPKHIYSIWRKMQKKNLAFDELFDVRAVRIVAERLQDCYAALGIVHTHYRHLPDEFDDYVANPKPNGYQSIHTVVLGPGGKTVEIQIRTKQMHEDAELGVAAHWKYKEGTTGKDSELDSKVRWLREVMDAQKDIDGAKEFMDAVKINVFDDEVFVFTPKGDVFDLPVGSTPLDLAYKIHSAIGNKCIGAKVNKRMVPFSTKLQNGDIVEIITSNSSKGPSLDWLKFVHTASARSKIRAYFKKEKKDENIARGKEMLEKEAKRRGYALADIFTPDILSSILQRHAMSSEDDLYAAVGFGGLTTSQVLTKIIQDFKKEDHTLQSQDVTSIPLAEQKPRKHSKSGVLVNGNANFTVRMAQCCSPVPGDDIVGYISRGRGVSIHRKDCPNVKGMEDERLIQASWDSDGEERFNATLTLICENKGGLLATITAHIANAKLGISAANVRVDEKAGIAEITVTVQITKGSELEELVKQLRSIDGVIEVRR